MVEPDSVFANNLWAVESFFNGNPDHHLGQGAMPNPVQTRLWDYNRYDALPGKVFKMAGNQSLSVLQAAGVELNTELVNAKSPFTAGSVSIVAGQLVFDPGSDFAGFERGRNSNGGHQLHDV